MRDWRLAVWWGNHLKPSIRKCCDRSEGFQGVPLIGHTWCQETPVPRTAVRLVAVVFPVWPPLSLTEVLTRKEMGRDFEVPIISSLISWSNFYILFKNVCRQWLNLSFKYIYMYILKRNKIWKKVDFWEPKSLDLLEFDFFLIRRDQWAHTIIIFAVQ